MREALHFDAVVIGAGTAGLTAATRLAQVGAHVCVLAKGVGSTHLAPGTIDVLGYAPERVDEPGRAVAQVAADHPYALLGVDSVAAATEWFARTAAAGPLPGYAYSGNLERNHLLPTALGALRPSALVPETMGAGDRDGLGRVVIAGTPALRDFHPSLCADNLRAAGIEAHGVSVELELERADMNAQGLARHFDDPAWRASFCARLLPLLGDEDHLGLPAMLGLRDPHAVLMDLQHRLGRWVFEIPTLPPSVPGMRLHEILRSALRSAGGRLVLGAEVVGSRRDGDRLAGVATRAAGRDLVYAAPWFVLASGGFASGAIELDSRWVTHDRVLGLPLRGAPGPGERRFAGAYLDDHPLARAGIAVDGELRAEGAENVFVAGASLPGAEPWREGSGEGIALASGYRVAELIAGQIGSEAAVA